MLGNTMVAQDPTHASQADDLTSISEIPGDLAETRSQEDLRLSDPNLQNGSLNMNGPAPKSDKPRPHVCTTCGRSFARLEHLKRHERSHTKEKPFECPECARCFARRDLLLRHQQKLHMTATPSSRPKGARRESTGAAGTTTNRVRKNSAAGASSSMRPRANTISHIDETALGMANAASPPVGRSNQSGHAYHPSLGSMSEASGFDIRNFGGGHPIQTGPLKIETSGLPTDMPGGLRTAPVYSSFAPDFGFGEFVLGTGNTINPAQLHFAGSPQGLSNDSPSSPFTQGFHGMPVATDHLMEEESHLDWISCFDTNLPLGNMNESAIEESSPSVMSTGSQSGTSEMIPEGSTHIAAPSVNWQNAFHSHSLPPSTFATDFSSPSFHDLGIQTETVSPKSLVTQSQFGDSSFATSSPVASVGPSMFGGHSQSMFSSSMVTNGEFPNQLNVPLANSPLRNSDSFPESARFSLLENISPPERANGCNYTWPANGILYPCDFPSLSASINVCLLANKIGDLERYISAYINYFHPHLPFLHLPTLDIQVPTFAGIMQMLSGQVGPGSSGVAGAKDCLLLSMATIGALYEFDAAVSKILFQCTERLIQFLLEEIRTVDMVARADSGRLNFVYNNHLWLIQAMLLNVIYGHTCGDRSIADMASSHLGTLVGLAKTAELTHLVDLVNPPLHSLDSHVNKAIRTHFAQPFRTGNDWLDWKIQEERKRTLYAIFVLPSLLPGNYNDLPMLANSEIQLDLPCAEDLWAAESPQAWWRMGGAQNMTERLSFPSALMTLLSPTHRESFRLLSSELLSSSSPAGELPCGGLKPSTFGCLVLIHALHNYISQTRRKPINGINGEWSTQEAEIMQANIEPALRAWKAAWANNPLHNVNRRSSFGAVSLSADSIPLLDLAYVKLFFDLDQYRERLSLGECESTSIKHIDDTVNGLNLSAVNLVTAAKNNRHSVTDLEIGDLSLSVSPTQEQSLNSLSAATSRPDQSKRERSLRKAAFHAASSISMSDRLGNGFAELSWWELPLQCALCLFECANVLAEWAVTVQERIGPYLGLLGRDEVDLAHVPAIMLLDDEDCKLIDSIQKILLSIEAKIHCEARSTVSISVVDTLSKRPSAVEGGYASKILVAAAYLLDRAAVWPVIGTMARSLETNAIMMKERAEKSVLIAT